MDNPDEVFVSGPDAITELTEHLYRVTLFLQGWRSKSDLQFKLAFDDAYRLYVKYNADRFDPGYPARIAALEKAVHNG